MTTTTIANSSAANLLGTVLENLQPGSFLQPQISAALNAALKTQLAGAAATAQLPALAGLISAMPAADLAAASDLPLQTFVQQQVDPMVSSDPTMKSAIDNEIAKLSVSGTVSDALDLTLPIASHPLLKNIVADAQLSALLAASPTVTSAMQARFVKLYDTNEAAMPEFWASLAQDPELGAVVPQLQLTLQLGTLTQNNPDLVAKLMAAYHPTTVRDLTQVTTDQLDQLMTAEDVQVPPSIASATTAATIAEYANQITSTLKMAFPTDYVGKSFSASSDPTNQAVGAFIGKSPDFDFATTTIDSYLKAHPDALAAVPTDQVAAVTARLKAAQRVFRVIPDGDVMQKLITLGLDSAYEISTTPSGAFLGQYAEDLGGEDQARQIYANAATISGVTSNIIRMAQENAATGLPRVISGGQNVIPKLLDTNIPDWQTLFGATSTCQCNECRAVDGPAAYFVSLLQFLGKMGKNAKGKRPLDVLLSRRPDLANLKLSCANSDTALPYVDLVNEILESYVANGELTVHTAHNTPSDATTATLDVTPEYLQTPDAVKAYQTLVGTSLVYPFTLPFDRYLATQRGYLTFLGLTRYQLLQAFGLALDTSGPDSPQLALRSTIAAEALLLSLLEYTLITQQSVSGGVSIPESDLSYYFGYTPTATWQKELAQVDEFLARTNLAFTDLVNLLETQYLNPKHLDPPNAATLLQTDTTDLCDTSKMSIQNGDAFFATLPAFVRLWEKVGWQVSELDYALRAFGVVAGPVTAGVPYPLPADFILIAAQLSQLQATLNLSLSQIVSLWHDIDVDGRASAYMSLFQNKAVLNPPDPAFQLLYEVPLAGLPSSLPATWSDGTAQGQLFYTTGLLQFNGSMSDDQLDDLLKWAGSSEPTILAVQLLYSQRWYDGIDLVDHPAIGDHLNAVLAALRVTASDLALIGQDAGLLSADGTWSPMSIPNLSALQRYAILARSLGLSVSDFITLKNLTGFEPFQSYAGSDRPATDPMVQFVTFAQEVTASQFNVAQLAYLYGPPSSPTSLLAPLQAAQDAVVATILAGLQNIAAANVAAPDPTGSILRKALSVLLPSALQLEPTMGLIGGTAVYSAALSGLPTGLTLPSGPVSFATTATVGGFVTANDTISLSVTATSLSAPVTVSYVAQAGDTTNTIASALATQINLNAALGAASNVATVAGNVITLPAPAAASSSPVWTDSLSSGASVTVTLAGSLNCTGPMSDALVSALGALSGSDPNFVAALKSLYDQAQVIMTENLGFLAAPGPYATALGALPSSVTPLLNLVTFCATAMIGGTCTAKDVVSLSCAAASTVTYTVQPGDTPAVIAQALAAEVNGAPPFAAAGISAIATNTLIEILVQPATTTPPAWTYTLSTGASETVTIGTSLVSSVPMLNSTQTALLAASSDASFVAAVNALYAQAWGSATDANSVIANLIDVQSTSTPADRYGWVLAGLLAYLTSTQSRNLVKQSLAQALSVDPSVVDLLLEGNAGLGTPNGLLQSSADPSQSAMTDFLGGLSGTYYSSATADPQYLQAVQVDAGVKLVVPSTGLGCVQWTAKILPPTTGAYRFALQMSGTTLSGTAPTLIIDQQTVPLTFDPAAMIWQSTTVLINLTAGVVYDFYLLISEPPPSSTMELEWSIAPLGAFAPIPALAFMPCCIPVDGTPGSDLVYPTLALLYRIAVLISGFSMSAADVAYLSTHPLDFAGTDPVTGQFAPFSLAGLPAASADAPALLNQWQRLNALYALEASLPTSNTSLFDVFAAAAANPSTTAVTSEVIAALLAATGWDSADVASLTGSIGFNCTNGDFRNEIRLVALAACISAGSNIGVSAQRLLAWANPATAADSATIAADIQHTVKAKYDDAAWLGVAKPLNDAIRESSKEALTAYVLYQQLYASGYRTADDLYGFFLIDVQMMPCMQTSRIVQASAAAQLFVQRCLLDLENNTQPADLQVSPSAFTSDDVTEWTQYRQNYRLWQAAVDVFLRPEDYWRPELSSNKSPFFGDLETTLLQNAVTAANVETAYRTYLESLQQVARLEIAGLYVDDDTETTHVVGRTYTRPYVYFHRQLDNKSYVWSPWEKINADIAGDTLIPIVWNRRLFLFWPLYTETSDPIANNPLPSDVPTKKIPTPPATLKTLQIQLAWSEYKNGEWTPKQVTADSLTPPGYDPYQSALNPSSFLYAAVPGVGSEDALMVTTYPWLFSEGLPYDLDLANISSFSFDGSQGSVTMQTPQSVSNTIRNAFRTISNDYAALYNAAKPTSDPRSVYGYQNISLADSTFGLVLTQKHSSAPALSTLLSSRSSITKPYEISFPQDKIPTCAIDVSQQNIQKVVYFADQRRTYFVVAAISSFATLPIRDPNSARAPSDVLVGSVYFFNHYHPWVGEFIKRLNWKGISYLLDPSTQALNASKPPSGVNKFEFSSYYKPTDVVAKPYPEEVVEFAPYPSQTSAPKSSTQPPGDWAYAGYNKEAFFLAPMYIARLLCTNHQYPQALQWLQYIFNPLQDPESNKADGYNTSGSSGYWNYLPFNKLPKDGGLDQLLQSLNGKTNTAADAQWSAWVNNPFAPDAVAELRPVAYQKAVVMLCLDIFIGAGDDLFRTNTRESINEAIQWYILAAETYGAQQTIIAQPGTVLDYTYTELSSGGLNQLGNRNVQLENAFPFMFTGSVSKSGKTGPITPPSTPYFCTPPDTKLLAYYNKIQDRLYKIRHCMNIDGQVEQLPLFASPISPALIAEAEAAGVDLSSLLNDVNAAVPYYRFTYMMAKTLELCGEVRSLGAAQLAYHEKFDAEGMALLRAGQELSVLQSVRQIKTLQIQEANDNVAALEASLAVATAIQTYYNNLVQGGLSSYETAQVAALSLSEEFKLIGQTSEIGAAGLAVIPQIAVGVNGAFGSPSAIVTFGGVQTSGAASAMSRAFSILADLSGFVASMSGLMGGWDRRGTEWAFQLQKATLDIAEIQNRIAAVKVAANIATEELKNQDQLISYAAAVQALLKSKFTNQQLYAWMVDQSSATYFQCYQMLYSLAKQLEACYRFELGIQTSNYIQFGYWDSLKNGLLAGEKLYQDLKRLENAYLDQNRREHEITKSISLLLLDPGALISFKLTGQCLITLPEAYFDMDYPGHYMRRIKSVSLTIPCVAGPYTNVNCTLTLLQSKIRMTTNGATVAAYPEQPIGSDPRFSYDFAATDSIVTSSGQNDSGMFDVSSQDERYYWFERKGVVSQWLLSAPPDCNAFALERVTDVIINLRHTARPGGDALRAAARSSAELPPRPVQPGAPALTPFPLQNNLLRLFSLRHEYPTEWYKFLNPPGGTGSGSSPSSMQINLGNERFPFQFRGKGTPNITQAELIAVFGYSTTTTTPTLHLQLIPPTATPGAFTATQSLGNAQSLVIPNPAQPAPPPGVMGGQNCWLLQCSDSLGALAPPLEDIYLICQFSAKVSASTS
jgi:Tc toxin complex TcA C-terminal TcB-binding domain/Neuraminidase-like domain/Salmonella virulence plasmid 28.1kDa A protein